MKKIVIKNTLKYALLLAGVTSLPAMAHIGYSGRDFGTLTNIGDTSTRSNNAATGNFGWIDGTDADWGDSHKTRAYRFNLTEEHDVSISFHGQTYGTVTHALTNPGFSLYQGLAHNTAENPGPLPLASDHDFGVGSTLIRDTIAGAGNTEGSFRALQSWSITNDSDPLALSPTVFTFIGAAYDGSIDYGTGTIPYGDGVADGVVTQTFHLLPGFYSIFVGGTDYSQQTGLGTWGVGGALAYGVEGVVSVVPEPETYAMLLAGLGLLGASIRRRRIS